MASSFNSDFYLTSAAAIPLFYLAAFVQEGNVISDSAGLIKNGIASTHKLAKNWLAAMFNYLKDRDEPGIRGIGFKCCLIAAGLIPFILILFIPLILAMVWILLLTVVLAGVLSEGISIWALFYQSDNLPLREIVLWAMLGLLVVMSVKPAVHVTKGLPWSSVFSRGPVTQAAPDVVGGRSGDASEYRVPVGVPLPQASSDPRP
jgi:small-conductance mechanosensitive channel